MIDPQRALRDVRANLRREVMPELESAHGRSVLASALGIIDELVERIQLDPAPARASAAELLAVIPDWERSLSGPAPDAAERVAKLRVAAQAALDSDPAAARAAALSAAETATAAAWAELEAGERDILLAQIRKPIRADVERQRGKT